MLEEDFKAESDITFKETNKGFGTGTMAVKYQGVTQCSPCGKLEPQKQRCKLLMGLERKTACQGEGSVPELPFKLHPGTLGSCLWAQDPGQGFVSKSIGTVSGSGPNLQEALIWWGRGARWGPSLSQLCGCTSHITAFCC